MNVQRFVISSIVVFIFVFVFEFIYHGVLLKGMYDATSEIWRPEEEHQMIYLFASQLWFAFMAVLLFTRNYEAKGIGEGLRFGILIGLVLGSVQLATYCYLPMPLTLTIGWIVGSFLKGTGSGVVASLVYRS